MKSAYELAMERLEKNSPAPKLDETQRQALAELSSLSEAKQAERETFLQSLISQAKARGDFQEAAELQQQLARDLHTLREELEAKKNKIWHQG